MNELNGHSNEQSVQETNVNSELTSNAAARNKSLSYRTRTIGGRKVAIYAQLGIPALHTGYTAPPALRTGIN